MTTPAWRKRQLEDAGDYGDPDRLSRRVRERTCRMCGARVIEALDADRCAWTAVADPSPIDALGEALALASDRATWDRTVGGDGHRLDVRHRWNIAGNPAGSDPHADVVAEHVCNSPPLPTTASNLQPPTPKEHDDEPPF